MNRCLALFGRKIQIVSLQLLNVYINSTVKKIIVNDDIVSVAVVVVLVDIRQN